MKTLNLPKRLLIVMCVSFCLSSSFASNVKHSIKTGINVSSMNTSTGFGFVRNFQNVVLPHIGVVADIPINKTLSLQPEALLNPKGFKYSYETTDMDGTIYRNDFAVKPVYLEVPIYLKVNLSNFTLGAGPYLSLGLFGKYKYTFSKINNGKSSISSDIDLFRKDKMTFSAKGESLSITPEKALFKRLDGGVAGFLGFDFSKKAFVSIAYSVGLINADNNPNIQNESILYETNDKMYNRTFSVSLGYKF